MIKCYHEKAFDAVVVVVVVVVAVVDVDVHCCLFFINSAVFRNIFWKKLEFCSLLNILNTPTYKF